MLYFLIGLFSNGMKLDKTCVALFFSVYFFNRFCCQGVSFFLFVFCFVLFFLGKGGRGDIYSSCYPFLSLNRYVDFMSPTHSMRKLNIGKQKNMFFFQILFENMRFRIIETPFMQYLQIVKKILCSKVSTLTICCYDYVTL